MTDYDKIEFTIDTITKLLLSGGISASVTYEDSLNKGLVFNVKSSDAKMLIGHQGATLHSLEHLVHAIVAKKFSGSENPFYFSLDIDEYKRKREWFLKQLAKDAVDEVKRTGNSLTLSPMSKYERKFVHTYIQEQFPHVTTESLGVDPYRKIKLSI